MKKIHDSCLPLCECYTVECYTVSSLESVSHSYSSHSTKLPLKRSVLLPHLFYGACTAQLSGIEVRASKCCLRAPAQLADSLAHRAGQEFHPSLQIGSLGAKNNLLQRLRELSTQLEFLLQATSAHESAASLLALQGGRFRTYDSMTSGHTAGTEIPQFNRTTRTTTAIPPAASRHSEADLVAALPANKLW